MDRARESVVAKYRVGSRRVVSVSEALKLAGLSSVDKIPNKAALAEGARRGREVHSWVELLDTGCCEWNDVRDDLVPQVRLRIEAWLRFREEVPCETAFAEKSYVHEQLQFGGTIDWVGKLNGQLALVDYKTGTPFREVALQTAGYALLLEWAGAAVEQSPKLIDRYGLYLKPTGRYKLVKYDSMADEPAFCAALQVARWKLANGDKLEGEAS